MILNPGVLALNSMFFILYSVWVSTLMCVSSYIDILNFILMKNVILKSTLLDTVRIST